MELEARIATVRLAETFVISRGASDAADVVEVELRHERRDRLRRGGADRALRRVGRPRRSRSSMSAGELLGDDPFALEEIEARLRERPGEQAAQGGDRRARCTTSAASSPACRSGGCSGCGATGPPTSWTIWLGDPDDMARRAEKRARAASSG